MLGFGGRSILRKEQFYLVDKNDFLRLPTVVLTFAGC